MEDQVDRLAKKTWEQYKDISASKRLMIAISGIPGSGKTTLAALVAEKVNELHAQGSPGLESQPVAAFIPMDGYHLSRAQLSALPDPATAHFRRGAAFTFDAPAFLKLVQELRKPLTPESTTLFAPSFDHAVKDPVADDIPIAPTARILVFEGNYLSLNQGDWARAAELMDELWFVEVDMDTARQRLIERHVQSGIVKDAAEAAKRADESDLRNGKEIIQDRLPHIHEVVTSQEDASWAPKT